MKNELRAVGLVMCTGARPHVQEEEDIINKNVPEVFMIGDRVKARGILEAVREGYDVARRI